MGNKNQVTLTFAGDDAALERTIDKVGSSTRKLKDDVGKSSKEVADGFDKAGAAADNTYDKFDSLEAVGRGTSDTMSGLSEIMKGNVLQGATDLAGGVAALADGFAGALLPALKAGVGGFKSAAVAAKAFTLSLLTNPVFLIGTAIAALVVGLVVLYKKSETARTIMNTAFSAIGRAVLGMAGIALRAYQLIVNAALTAAEKVVGAMAKIPGPQQKYLQQAAGSIREFRQSANDQFDKAIGKVNEWDAKLRNLPSAKKITVTVQFRTVGNTTFALNTPSSVGRRAGGGDADANMPYWVGERGPEPFIPNTSGTILPNRGNSTRDVSVELGPRTIAALAKAQARSMDGARIKLDGAGGSMYGTLVVSGG